MESISKVIKQLMINEPYYGLFACSLNKIWDNKINTAAVGQEGLNFNLHVNKTWWDSIDANERYGTIKHELLHLAFFHVVNMDKWKVLCNNHNTLNVAMDLEVQSYIDKQYWGDPKKYAAEGIFDRCPQLPLRQGTKYYIEFLKQVQNTPSGQDLTFDPGDKGNNQEEGNESFSVPSSDVSCIKDMLQNGSKDDHSTFDQISESSKELMTTQLEWQMKEAYEQVIKSRGKIPGELRNKLEQLLKIKPPVFNWKAYFRRLLGFAYDVLYKKTRRKESNRFPDSYGLKHNKKHSILVAIDTSGSVSQEELKDFFSEINHIWKAGSDIKILECDTRITAQYKYKGKMPEFVSGRGGTSFQPVIEYYNEYRKDYNVLVYFTDGYGDQEACHPFGKVLWVITSCGYQDGEYPGYKICIPKNN